MSSLSEPATTNQKRPRPEEEDDDEDNGFEELEANNKKTKTIEWTASQKRVIEAIQDGHNVFLTGEAGTGKSCLLRHVIDKMRLKGLYVTSTTGISALPLGGRTLHSWSGMGISPIDAKQLAKRIDRDDKLKERWINTKTLIIDEIGMWSSRNLELIDKTARIIKKQPNIPFGGIQVIASGDFCQLPPITGVENAEKEEFAFKSHLWNTWFPVQVVLGCIFRQSDNSTQKALSKLRVGVIDEQVRSVIEPCINRKLTSPPTILLPTNKQIDIHNDAELKRLKGTAQTYYAKDNCDDSESYALLEKGCLAPKNLVLKEGAQVMLLKNLDMDQKLVNGSIGVVQGFTTLTEIQKQDNPESEPEDEEKKKTDSDSDYDDEKIPIVKWTSGSTMIMKKETWEIREAISSSKEKKPNRIQQEDEAEQAEEEEERDNKSKEKDKDKETKEGRVIASRTQYPLMLAWSISIHKSQGMGLECVETDLRRCFDDGQCYVALSRAKSFDKLRIVGSFPERNVRANKDVIAFYERIAERPENKGE